MNRLLIPQRPEFMGKSSKILKFIRELRKFANNDNNILIKGEPGTGRQVTARTLHNLSQRKDGPFIIVDLSSMSHEKQAFLISKEDKKIQKLENQENIFEKAISGSIFFLEIADMYPEVQTEFIKLIKDSMIEDENKKDVRIICSTGKDLEKEVEKGNFNQELYKILSSSILRIPPLRERKEDLINISKFFLDEACEKFETGTKEFLKDARDFILKYDWPGNTRELETTIKRAVILSDSSVISKKDLILDNINSFSIKEFLEEKLKKYLMEMTKLENCNLYETVMKEVEKSLITIVLKETDGNQLKTAKTLGINRNTLRSKIKEYKIKI
ncbi:MAG: sigma-54-dependent Fis family transcriptional regulator [Nitrospirae bacterium]|nr:sigma-54-dependent Fis family transcriptional regulator [Nitrospirota bacterium]